MCPHCQAAHLKENRNFQFKLQIVTGGKRECEKYGLWLLSNVLVWTTVWAFLQATEIYLNSLLFRTSSNSSRKWRLFLKQFEENSFTLKFRTDLHQANFPFCTGNKVPLFSKVCILVFSTGICQHHPCIAVKISSLLSTWSQLCSVCENVFGFVHPGRQKIRMCMEKHHCRLSNIQE